MRRAQRKQHDPASPTPPRTRKVHTLQCVVRAEACGEGDGTAVTKRVCCKQEVSQHNVRVTVATSTRQQSSNGADQTTAGQAELLATKHAQTYRWPATP